MRMRLSVLAFLLIVCPAISARAQQIQVSRQNRTLAVSATDTAETMPDVAVVSIGYSNYGKTHDAAYDGNIRGAEKIFNALRAAGVPKNKIQTDSIDLTAVQYPHGNWTPEESRERQFEATQIWKLRLSAETAQKYVDVAVQAGANQLRNIDWQTADQTLLEAKADAAALSKARTIAEKMATQLRIRLGVLIFASNQPVFSGGSVMGIARGIAGGMLGTAAPPPPHLKLFPKKVSQSATVYAVFAIQ